MGKTPVLKFGGVTMQGQNSDHFRPDEKWLAKEGGKAGKALEARDPMSLTHFLYRLIERQRNMARVDRMKQICRDYIIPAFEKGKVPVVVVSAFDWATDKLVHLAECIVEGVGDNSVLKHKSDKHRCVGYICHEYARLLMSGELRANSALALTLNALGYGARSLTGREAGIATRPFDADKPGPTHNLIERVDPVHVRELVKRRIIPIVAGFQGYYIDDATGWAEVSTLDRGGSNLTAVALARWLGEKECVMYSDVPCLYDKDPREHEDARPVWEVRAEELLAWDPFPQVIQRESVEYARQEQVNIWIRSGSQPKARGSRIVCRP